MKFSDIKAELTAPFEEVSFRVGSTTEKDGTVKGKPLAYINAAQVIDRLNEHCPDDWSDAYEIVRQGVWKCKLTVCGVTHEGVGMSGADDEEGEKSAESDALKRAAVKFGIGLYLRNWDLPYVPLESIYTNRKGKKTGYMPRSYKPPFPIPLKTKKILSVSRQATISADEAPPEQDEQPVTKPVRLATSNQVARINREIEQRQLKSPTQVADYLARCGVPSIEELPYQRASELITYLDELPRKATVKA